MGKRTLAVLAGLVLAVGLLAACADSKDDGPVAGEDAATVNPTEGRWKHVTKFNGYDINMQCQPNGTGIYVLGSHYALSVVQNDPLCK